MIFYFRLDKYLVALHLKSSLIKRNKKKHTLVLSQTCKEFKLRRQRSNQMSVLFISQSGYWYRPTMRLFFVCVRQKRFSPSGVWGDATATCRCEKSGCCTHPEHRRAVWPAEGTHTWGSDFLVALRANTCSPQGEQLMLTVSPPPAASWRAHTTGKGTRTLKFHLIGSSAHTLSTIAQIYEFVLREALFLIQCKNTTAACALSLQRSRCTGARSRSRRAFVRVCIFI